MSLNYRPIVACLLLSAIPVTDCSSTSRAADRGGEADDTGWQTGRRSRRSPRRGRPHRSNHRHHECDRTARTRGQIGYPKPGTKFGSLNGFPVIEKLIGYAPIEDIDRCSNCAKLFIIAEHEELFDNKDHAILAHERATGVKKLVVLKDIKHYGIYREKRQEAQQLAIDWFTEHLKNAK